MGYPIVTPTARRTPYDVDRLDELAHRHLWMHFSRLGALRRRPTVPIIARGEGCYVWDAHGKRYLDALSGLFTVQVGHGRTELAEAAAAPGRDARVLPDLELRAPARDRARGPARRARARRPEPGLLHHRRLRGGRVGVEARPRSTSGRSASRTRYKVIAARHRVPRHDDRRARDHRRPGAARRRSSR